MCSMGERGEIAITEMGGDQNECNILILYLGFQGN